ncbi:ABC transporter [Marinicauda salina]|uniref:ABC transporter n=1 Tax=Marinicauda salina TaxID=2135793 RepID=A0A2U2BX68_9PROT|nr:ABC transporter ATP-binding protein [Marinicauda salina]PWE18564.1 ABC transporter [Marinicauda salina]
MNRSTRPDDAPAAEVRGLTKRFGAATAVDDVAFTIGRGETVALLGGNGAGKTTTIAMLLGLITPSAGTIAVLGHDIARQGAAARARMNFQSPYVDLPKRLSVRRNLTVYARLYGLARPAEAVARVCAELKLEPLMDRRTGSLSAGQSTRVGLAKALVNDPDFLLLDEPTASLDPDTADWVRSALETWRARHRAAILLASHNMGEVERLADRVLMMKSGRIVDDASPRALLDKYGRTTLEEVFLHVARGTAEDAA